MAHLRSLRFGGKSLDDILFQLLRRRIALDVKSSLLGQVKPIESSHTCRCHLWFHRCRCQGITS